MKEFVVVYNGGLGDIFRQYFCKDDTRETGYIKDLKHKGHKINAFVFSHSDASYEFIKSNPHIDTIEYSPYIHETITKNDMVKKRFPNIERIYQNINILSWNYEEPEIYLNKQELDQFQTIQEPYVFIHPFASNNGKDQHICNRVILDIINLNKIIDFLIDELKVNCVVVGKNYTFKMNYYTTEIKELYDYKRPGLYNLVNNISVNLAVKLCYNAKMFFGSHSAFSVISDIHKLPILRLLPDNLASRVIENIDPNDRIIGSYLLNKHLFYKDVNNNKVQNILKELLQ